MFKSCSSLSPLLMKITHYRRVVIILEINVVKPAEDVGGKLGDPVPYSEGEAFKCVFTLIVHQSCFSVCIYIFSFKNVIV